MKPADGRLHRRVAQAFVDDAEGSLTLLDGRLGRSHSGEVRAKLGLSHTHLVGMLSERGLHHGQLGSRRIVQVTGTVDVSGGNDFLLEQLLASLQLRARPFRLGLGPRDIGLERGRIVPHPAQRCLTGSHGGLRP